MTAIALGTNFEREIRDQPNVWERIATSDKAQQLARTFGEDDLILLGSGSSLYVAELGALALRRRRLRATALPATEARLDYRAYEGLTVIAISQSGRSSDIFEALDILRPRRLVALTNSAESPLARRAQLAIDVGAGTEHAVPASKSVSTSVAVLLWAASIFGNDASRNPQVLLDTAQAVREWLQSPGVAAVAEAAQRIAKQQNVAILGSDYGLPIAKEAALKFKEASYMHAEGFAAGEFRHGSIAMVDASFAVIGIVDDDALPVVSRPMRELKASGALRYVIGAIPLEDIFPLGPTVDNSYNTLGWLVTAQLLALFTARARGVESDVPRGLTKALVSD